MYKIERDHHFNEINAHIDSLKQTNYPVRQGIDVQHKFNEIQDRVQNVKDLAGTEEAAGDFGRGAGGDISRNIDITAEQTVLDYLKEINFECIVLGEECGRVELSDNPKGYIIMDAIDGSANAVRGVPFFCSSLAFATENKLSSITDGVITDLTNGDMYWASKGKGSFLNEKQIKVQQKVKRFTFEFRKKRLSLLSLFRI